MKVLVLKELPQGQQPGEVIEITEAEADVLTLPGVDAVRRMPDTAAIEAKRRRYSRRDLVATDALEA